MRCVLTLAEVSIIKIVARAHPWRSGPILLKSYILINKAAQKLRRKYHERPRD